MTFVAPRIVNDVSYVTQINHEIHFAWQAQYFVNLSFDVCCSAHCNGVSYATRINHEIHFAWQAQYLVKLGCDFSWQAQHFVQFWEIAGASKCCIFPYKMRLQDGTSKVSEAAGAR